MGQWCLGPLQSRHLGTSHSSPSISSFVQSTLQHPLLESPSAAPLYFPESPWLSEISSLSKVISVLGKTRSHRVSHLGCRGAEFNILRCSACCRSSRTWIIVNRFSTIFGAFVPHFHLCFTHCMIPERLLNHPNSFHGGMCKLNAKFDADLLLYSLSHFKCNSHTVHMLTQWHLPPPLTSTVKVSTFMHTHSSALPLAARLHQCSTNCSCYINNGWAFSGQTLSCIWIYYRLHYSRVSG